MTKAVRREVPLSSRQRRAVRMIAGCVIAPGAIILLKVAVTLAGDTAWEAGFSASREGQPAEYWTFVVTWALLGCGMVWLGISVWRSR